MTSTVQIICLLITCLVAVSVAQQNDEARLFAFLAARYKNEYLHTRPIVNGDDNVTVELGLTLMDIQDFDTRTGFGTFFVFDKLQWQDSHLQWKPDTYGGLDNIRMPSNMLWKPDIVLYNSQDMNEDRYQSMVVVYNDGRVLWIPRSKYHIRCYVPEDGSADYECKLKFGSWVYKGTMVDLALYNGQNKTEVDNFFGNNQWEIVDNYARYTNTVYDCCPDDTYPDVSFYLKLNYKGPIASGAPGAAGAGGPWVMILALMVSVVSWFHFK